MGFSSLKMFFLTLSVIAMFVSCAAAPSTSNNNGGGSTVPTFAFAGRYYDGGNYHPLVWIDGTMSKLLDAAGTNTREAFQAAIDGSDVYACGDTGSNAPCYWKNGTHVSLGSGATAFGIAVNAGLLSVCGYQNDADGGHGVWWTNGVRVVLTNASFSNSYAYGTAIYGGNVYVCGSCNHDGAPQDEACYWVNGNYYNIAYSLYSYAMSVTANSTGFLIAGYYFDGSKDYACVWTNGNNRIVLTNSASGSSYAFSIAANDGDWYAGGNFNQGSITQACIWKNGIFIPLTNASTSCNYSVVTAMIVSGTDWYAGGYYEDSGNYKACYWLNGTFYPLESITNDTMINPIDG